MVFTPVMLAAALAQVSCQPACDQGMLLAALETFERELSTSGAEVRALRGIAVACPRLHRGLTESLLSRYKSVGRPSSMTRYDDAFYAAKNAACDNPQKWVKEASRAPEERRPEIFWDACGLARLGVLDEGERLLHGDEEVFFLLAALDRFGVDRGLVRRFGRGFLNSVAPLSVAHQRCTENDDDQACLRLLDVAGLEPLPLGDGLGAYSGRPALRLLVSREAILWDGETIAKLEHGALRPADIDLHTILPLTAVVEDWATRLRNAEPEDDTKPRLEIAVDRRLPIGLVTDILYTVTTSGVSNLALVGRIPTTLAASPVWVQDGRTFSGPNWIAGPIIIDDAGVHANLPSGDVTTVPIGATKDIVAIAEEIRVSGYDRVLVRAVPSIRVDVVVPIINVLAGSKCLDSLVYEARGHGCLRPILDHEPAIPK